MFDRLMRLASLSASCLQGESGHVHVWQRMPDTLGFFRCESRFCSCCAVCPGCLGSIEVALQVDQGIVGLHLFWCSSHCGVSSVLEKYSYVAVTHTCVVVDNNYENEHEEDIVDYGYVIDFLPDGRVRIADELTLDYQLTGLSTIFEFDPRTVVSVVVLPD